MSLLNSVIYLMLTGRNILAKKGDRYYFNRYRASKLLAATNCHQVSILHTAMFAFEGASQHRNTIREMRRKLSDAGAFRWVSRPQHHQCKSPPCLFTCINLDQCLLLFQQAYARFYELEAQLKQDDGLRMPYHHCTVMREIFQARFGVSCSKDHVVNVEELQALEEAKKAEKQQEARGKWVYLQKCIDEINDTFFRCSMPQERRWAMEAERCYLRKQMAALYGDCGFAIG